MPLWPNKDSTSVPLVGSGHTMYITISVLAGSGQYLSTNCVKPLPNCHDSDTAYDNKTFLFVTKEHAIYLYRVLFLQITLWLQNCSILP